MRIADLIKGTLTEFLFPKSRKVLELEALKPNEILELPRAEIPPDKLTFALLDYKNKLTKELVWELKYRGNKLVAETLGTILCDSIYSELEDYALFESPGPLRSKILLMPIPISQKRREERGWNQSEILAKAILARDTRNIFEYLPNTLVKVRHTSSQTATASRRERLENLKGSMRVLDKPGVTGRTVVVLDDVTTTGSTFKEARRALEEARAARVICLALAH